MKGRSTESGACRKEAGDTKDATAVLDPVVLMSRYGMIWYLDENLKLGKESEWWCGEVKMVPQ